MARKILLADDSVTAQNMGRKILADAGYEVITVNNGSAALKKIAEHKPDLIILDVYMPGYSGLEVCQRLKEVPGAAAKALAFLILTAGRSGEVLGAQWNEIDEAAAVWTVPAHRMKAAKMHRVPLSAPALEIIADMWAARRGDHPFVFPGQRPRKPLSNMALEMTMRRLGAGEFTPHGMR